MGKFPLWDSVSASLKGRLSNDTHEPELWTVYVNPFSFRAVLSNALFCTPMCFRIREIGKLNTMVLFEGES